IGMLGIMEDLSKHTGIAFQEEDDMIILLGDCRDDIGSSEYLKRYHQIEKSPAPYFDIDEELKLQKVVSLLIKEGFCKSAHDISEGGLFTTLIECAIVNEIGFNMSTDGKYRKDAFLFGESQSRVVITVSREKLYILMNYLNLISFPYDLIGRVENSHVVIDGEDFGNISYWKNVHQNTLGDIMS
ncbi:MAG: phosphoribosylformylglycinamidine synthase subunit PurL, partial [Chitinophagaceae bacterium]|nr:phosphoribosylformylglycinamidine synthase subunit PurL [Chitinophagaceae bacterium]